MEVTVLGTFGVAIDGVSVALGGPQQRLVLALLVAARGDVITTEQLIDRVWEEELPDNPRKTIQVHVANLRAMLGGKAAPISTEGGGYRLAIDDEQVDAYRFERMALEARSRLRTDPARAAHTLDGALDLWHGTPYADLTYMEALQGEIRRLQELRLVALEDRSEADLEAGAAEKALPDLELLTTEHPLRERPCGLLMLALYRTGQQSRALRAYQTLRRHLGDGLGIDPSPELQVLEQRILDHDPDLLLTGEVAPLDLPYGTVTFMFADIEGAPSLWEEHRDAMSEAVAAYDEVLHTVLDEHGGYVFSASGDRFSVAFTTAIEAIGAAIAALQRVREASTPFALPLRFAIHTGEAMLREGDYFGAALNRCSRLLEAAHGSQVLVSSATAEIVSERQERDWALRDLGEHQLRGLSRREHIFQVVHEALPADFSPLQALWTTNLPAHVTSFIGRDHEMAEAAKLLSGSRLVTLTGAAGSGKTRLALELAGSVASDFSGGVSLVELAPVADPDLVAGRVADVIGAADREDTPSEVAIAERIASQDVLVVLDNCEHLIAATAPLVESLLARCPGLKVLATSREVLGLTGEVAYPVEPMKTPEADMDVLAIRRFDSVRLFTERAAGIQPDFAVTADNVTAVVDICRRLDGLPLAIELAAVRLRILSPHEIASRLDDRLRLLRGGSRRGPTRQETLLGALDWSYDLLEEAEQVLFERLSVFSGGWSLAAAEEVCGLDPLDPLDVLDLLAALVDKSMVSIEAGAEATRYRMLQTVREYARSRLGEPEREGGLQYRHLEHYCRIAEAVGELDAAGRREDALHTLAPDHDNLRAALRFSVDHNHLAHAARIVEGAGSVWLAAPFDRDVVSKLESREA